MEILKRLLVCIGVSLFLVMIALAISVFSPFIAEWFISLPDLGKFAIIAFICFFITINIKYDENDWW